MRQRGVEYDSRESMAQCMFELVAQGQKLGVASKAATLLQGLQHSAQGGDTGHVLGAAAQAAFLSATDHQRCERRPAPRIQQAYALGRM